MAFPKDAYFAQTLIGGAQGSLDGGDVVGDGDNLDDLDMALVNTFGVLYPYTLDDDDGGVEDSPNKIQPDTNPGTKMWILQGMRIADLITPQILSPAGSVLTLGTVGGEDLTWDFESVANQVRLASGTSAILRADIAARFSDNIQFQFGDSADSVLRWRPTGNHYLQLGLKGGSAAQSGYFSIIENADTASANRSPSASSVFGATSANPVLAGYSSDATQAGDMWGVVHDQSDTRFRGGNGSVIIDTIANNDMVTIGDGVIVAGDVTLDDGVGASPSLKFISGTNNDVFEMFLEDEVFGGQSDMIFRLTGNSATSKIIFQDLDKDPIFTFTAGGRLGIGTINPQELLQVDDAIAISNDTEGSIGRMTIRTTHETHTLILGASSVTTTITIPSGAMLYAVSFNVDTAVTDDGGDDTWSAAFSGGSTTTLATDEAAAQDTKVNTMIVPEIASATTEITFTPNGGNFSAGIIEIIAYYIDLTSLANV